MALADEVATRSTRGRIAVHFDMGKWISCPPVFPEDYNLQTWAHTYAEAFCTRPGFKSTGKLVDALAGRLMEIHADAYDSGRVVCHLCFIYQADPLQSPLPVYMSAWDSRGERNEMLRMLVHADEPDVAQGPYVEEFTATHLGTGLKGLYYKPHPRKPSVLYAGLSYAWRVEELATDLLISASTTDVRTLQQAMPDIDQLANVTKIVPIG